MAMPPKPNINADDVKARVDTWVAVNWQTIVDKQEEYRAAYGVYWQGLVTHSARPRHSQDDYNPTPADRLDIKPSDVAETWGERWPGLRGVNFDFALRVDQYEAPAGHGWQAVLQFEFANPDTTIDVWEKAWQYGPETWRAYDWHLVNEEPLT